jgi:ATP-binding cassette subfamily B (MDR/TAP) protein 1
MHVQRLSVPLLIVDQRIFTYADLLSWTLNVIALMATIGAGASLPLLDFILGKTVTTFNNFQTGSVDPARFRSEASKWAYVNA